VSFFSLSLSLSLSLFYPLHLVLNITSEAELYLLLNSDFSRRKQKKKQTQFNLPFLCFSHLQRVKHIEIKHHFIRDCVQKGVIDIQFIDIEHQWVDIFTKLLVVEQFDFIKKNLNMHFISE